MAEVYRDKKGNEFQVCCKCDRLKPIDDYWKDRRKGLEKHRATCIACESERKAAQMREQHEPTRLPAAPLLEAVERRRDEDTSWQEMAIMLGTSARTFNAWRRGERMVVNMDTADKIVTGLGLIWEDVFDDKTCERLRAVV